MFQLPLQDSSPPNPKSPISKDVDDLLPRTFDQSLTLIQTAEKEGMAKIGTQVTMWSNNVRAGCLLTVRCITTVMLVKDINGSRKKKGSTEYQKAEIDSGTWTGINGNGGSYTQIIIPILIKLNLKSLGKKWEEENKKVKQERKKAQKKYQFKRLPLEFTLIHELLHRNDVCKALSDIAKKAISCNLPVFSVITSNSNSYLDG